MNSKTTSPIMNRSNTYGNGEPFLFLHGMGEADILKPVIAKLAEHYKLIAPIFPGFLSQDGPINYTNDLYVEFIDEGRNELDIDKWNAIGISMGGRTLLNYAVKYENNISKCILIDSAGYSNFSPLFLIPGMRKTACKFIVKMLNDEKQVNKFALADFVNNESNVAVSTAKTF